MANKIQIKRGLKAKLPTLNVGEPALCTDTKEVFIGSASGNFQLAKTEYISNPNLLINGDFQVWHRGTSFIAKQAHQYTADRWMMIGTLDTLNKVDKVTNGVKITTGTSYILYFKQILETIDMLGKTVTISCSVDGILYKLTATISTTNASITTPWGVFYTEYSTVNNLLSCSFAINPSKTITINWVKLELGEIATPLSPRPYGEEKALCQRYYQIINVGGRSKFITQDQVVFQVNYPVKMRISPTIKEINAQVTKIDATPIAGFLLKYPAIQEDLLVADFHKAGHGLSDASGGVVLALDSEIY